MLIVNLYLKLFRQWLFASLKLSPQTMCFRNREGILDFNYCLPLRSDKAGVSAFLRVKNEEQKIIYCLQSIIDAFDEIIFVDNGSEDSTSELVKAFKQEHDREDKIKIYQYPWKISRCGSEHFATAEDSVHSLAYYYNWTLSHCTFQYICKWDADMVLRKDAQQTVKIFLKEKLLKEQSKTWLLAGQTVYRSLDGQYFLSQRLAHERRLFPLSYLNRYFKEERWEVLRNSPPLPVDEIPGVTFYEMKFTNEDETSHWSPQTLSSANNPSDELREEKERFELIKEGKYQDQRFTLLPSTFLDYSGSPADEVHEES